MEKLVSDSNIAHIDLCDWTQEPSDDELARLMECVAQESNAENKEAAMMLGRRLEREIAGIVGRVS